MANIFVIYYSGTGNTEAMAQAVAKGIEANGNTATLKTVDSASIDDIKDATSVAFGCPAMGAEVLEEGDMEPFIANFESIASGKKVALFGSYGWGDGEWMRDWAERMTNAGATVCGGEGVICQDAPDDETLAKLEELGKSL